MSSILYIELHVRSLHGKNGVSVVVAEGEATAHKFGHRSQAEAGTRVDLQHVARLHRRALRRQGQSPLQVQYIHVGNIMGP